MIVLHLLQLHIKIQMDQNLLFNIFGILFLITFIVQIYYYLVIFSKLAFYKIKPQASFNKPVSVIICAKNESENLINNLPLIFNQTYSNFEVVVVNDCSWDDTKDILEAMQIKHSNLHVVTLTETDSFNGGKKLALTLGIKGAKHNHFLLTDADCKPSSQLWLQKMVNSFSQEKSIVLGVSSYEKANGLLNKIIRFDNFFVALQYLSFALRNNAYMGVGRNLAYTKDVFFKASGFKSHYHIPSGDDDLFVNQVSNATNTIICVDKDAHTTSKGKTSWTNYWRQKRRHFSTAKFYKTAHQMALSIYPISLLIFIVTFVGILFSPLFRFFAIGIFIVRIIIQIIIFSRSTKYLRGNKDIIWLMPFGELFLLFLNPAVHFANKFSKQVKWK
jgi:poly-beta-1,6-N-acetyl-D-glucosamine synthase